MLPHDFRRPSQATPRRSSESRSAAGRNVRVFGSVARGVAVPGSDVNFLVDFDPERTVLDLSALILELQAALGCEDDATRGHARGCRTRRIAGRTPLRGSARRWWCEARRCVASFPGGPRRSYSASGRSAWLRALASPRPRTSMSTVRSTMVARGTSGCSPHQTASPVVADRISSASGSRRSSGI